MIKPYFYNNKKYYEIQLSFTSRSGKRKQPKFRLHEGKRISSMVMARRIELEKLVELKEKDSNPNLNITFREFHQSFLKKIKLTHRNSTILSYELDILKWCPNTFLEKSIDDFTSDMIHSFIHTDLKEYGASVSTQKKILKLLSRVFTTAVECDLINRNPCLGIRVKTPPPDKKVLNSEEVKLFLLRAKQVDHPMFYLWAVALLTGMRNGELYALRWTNVDIFSHRIIVSNSYSRKDGYTSTKSNKTRIVPISNELKEIFLELKNMGPFQEEFKTERNGRTKKAITDLVLPRLKEWKNEEQSRITKQFCRELNITPVRFHDLRATFITNLLAAGVPSPKVMSIVGHTKLSTTDTYLRFAGVDIKGVTEHLGYRIPVVEDVLNVLKI